MFIYEATITRNEEGYFATVDDIGGVYADGDTFNEAIEGIVETLQLVLAEYLDTGMTLPKPSFQPSDTDSMRVAIAVEVSPEFIARSKCLTPTEAARELGLSKGRISQLLNCGKLQAIPFGNERLVTLASIHVYKKTSRKAGRPRKSEARAEILAEEASCSA
ncbi:MAG: type II toxin-antitoxin system HicB family antitoxin [Eggerthellaceae bacterium]|jgi:excisionase family DNA binding protein|nr:type II toxin-antitoxin system HicB family antitoxin [Eggerthellaceae bacterium]MDR2721674.1 type II toxin-antitoxin system HicB family antitoxin [Coriobacteriaceae bacterium]